MKEKKGMRSAALPKEHFEKDLAANAGTSNLKYAGQFSNPEDLKKSTDDLAAFVRKKQMKY